MITQEIRRHAALVALCAGNQVSKIATFLKTDKSFSYKINWGWAESGGHFRSVVRQKKTCPSLRHCQKRRLQVSQVQNIIDIDAKNRLEPFSVTGSTMWLVRDLGNVFQKDPAPANEAKGTQEWLTANVPRHLTFVFMTAVFI